MRLLKTKQAAAALLVSAAGLLFIQNHEGTAQKAYLDPVGIPTICSGSTAGVRLGMTESTAGCAQRLREDSTYAGKAVARCTSQRLTQEQYDALVSLSFNIGGGAYCRSTLVRKLNTGDCLGAGEEFLRWNRAGGRVLPGLTKRRAQERDLFLKGCVE